MYAVCIVLTLAVSFKFSALTHGWVTGRASRL